MKNKNICTLAVLSALLFSPLGATSFAFDLSLLKNDKEAQSHTYTARSLRHAEAQLSAHGDIPNISEKSYAILGQSFNLLEDKKDFCDLNLFRLFLGDMERAGLPADLSSLKNIFIVWRSQNKIDDIFVKVLNQIATLHFELIVASPTAVANQDIGSMEQTLKNKEINEQTFASIYSGYAHLSVQNPGCSIDNWIRSAGMIEEIEGRGVKKITLANSLALSKNLLTTDNFALLETYLKNDVQNWQITLNKYISILKQSKNRSRVSPLRNEDLEPNTLSSKLQKRPRGETYRESLYYRFNATQINMISSLLKKAYERMDAAKSEIVITFNRAKDTKLPEKETYLLSPMEQFRMASKMLRKDMVELSQSSFFQGMAISHEDLITAAMETGLINETLLDSAMKIDDLWNPYVPTWKKISDYALQVTGTASIFLPPPYNVIGSIALIFLSGQISKKTATPNPMDNPNVIF